MTIAICEDSERDIQYLIQLLEQYENLHNLKLEIFSFKKAEKFMESLKDNQYELVFLDIYLDWDETDGIKIGQELKKNQKMDIVYTTVSREFAVESYQIGAIHYLLKPYTYEHLEEAMKRCRFLSKENGKMVSFKVIGSSVLEIKQKEILYMESFDRILEIHTENAKYETYQRLSSMYKMLDSKMFVKPQRSYLVNLSHVKKIRDRSMVLTDGTEIDISRRLIEDIKKQYYQYLFSITRI